MKRGLLTLALVALTAIPTYAQGTIAFGNGTLTRICIFTPGGTPGVPFRLATAADGLNFYVFWGPAGVSDPSALTQVPQSDPKAAIGSVDGIMINAPSVFALPGTEPGQVVSLQIRAWNAERSIVQATDIRQVTLGATAGPGQVIWQSASGTNPNRFPSFCIPEPSTIALAVLGLVSLLLFRRRKYFA